MIKHKEKNKYSLNAESYGISKVRWRKLKEAVIEFEIDSMRTIKDFKLNYVVKNGTMSVDEDLCKKRVWFLYDILLQEKYNHLYKREKLVNPKVGDYVYCDYEGFGRGTITRMSGTEDLMTVRFDSRKLDTMCSSSNMTTVFDDIKRKITRI